MDVSRIMEDTSSVICALRCDIQCLLFGYGSEQGSRDSALGVATVYGMDYQGVGVRVPVGSRIYSSPHHWGGGGLFP
jgi:hypothetical protein